MKRIFIGPLALGLIVLFSGCKGEVREASRPQGQDLAGPKEGPRIFCEEPVFDFGSVSEGEEVKHLFIVKNVGDDVLNILSARGG